ncbi:hypothetical protein LNO23_24710 [Klebsiella pneumoniae subsp. pneumoniae]|nr:hypothetical protein [Klebsiella pneumoniae subsp. pneumoniae]
MKLKVLALAATLGLTTMAAQASELPDGPHIVTSRHSKRCRGSGHRHPGD